MSKYVGEINFPSGSTIYSQESSEPIVRCVEVSWTDNGNEELFEKHLYQILHSDYNLIAESIGADGFQAKTPNWAPEYNDFLLQIGEAIWYNDAQGLGELLMVHARNYVERYVRGLV